jgi:hypothetical protein
MTRLKRCVQCFQDLAKDKFSKRQYLAVEGKCIECVIELEKNSSMTPQLAGRFFGGLLWLGTREFSVVWWY